MNIFTPVGTWARQHRTSNGLGPQRPPHSDPTPSWDKSLEFIRLLLLYAAIYLFRTSSSSELLLVGGILTSAYAQIFNKINYSILIAINFTVVADVGQVSDKHYHFILLQTYAP